jgi:prepilin-type N-terminal cleavage/methylation domain-containing protein
MRLRSGFTLIELMVSIAILTLISTATVFSLRSTRENEELLTAARLLAGDVRSIQARALAARNVRQCSVSGGALRVCENDNTSDIPCIGACEPAPPPRFGISLAVGATAYDVYADVNVADGRYTNDEELLLHRDLNPLGGEKVMIRRLLTEQGDEAASSMIVSRQNGEMRIDACNDPGFPACAPSEPRTLSILLRHQRSGKELTVDVNAVTGRVSLP